jgi:tetratricopeptide (TPR) repeat protein
MSALRLLLLATGLCLLGCPRPLPSQLATSQLVNVSPASDPSVNLAKLPSSLVYVRSFCKRTASQPDVTGTAFVVGHSDGWSYLISARHVLFPRECGPAPHPLAQRVELRGEGVLPFDGDPSELIEKATDSQGDLILFHAQGKRDTAMARLSVLVPEMLGSGAEPMDALGFTTLQARSTQPQSERSRGLLSTNNREGRLVLTTEAKLYPSMSGGPVALHSSGLVVGVVLGEYEAQKGAIREGRITSLAPLIDLLPEALRQQLGIVLHYSVSAAYQPIPLQPTWVERPEQAKVLAVLDAVPKGQAPARVLLHGIGGVGKTTLAYQVAALRQGRFPGGTVKVELKDRTTDLVLSDLIEALTGRRPQPGDWFKLVRAQLASRPPMLVILDNVRLDEAPWNQPEVMEPLLQALTPATLVMTSRSRQAPPGFAPILLVSLPDKEATELAGKLAKQKGVALAPEQAALLGRLLGGLPFAIERAVELMHSENHSAQSLLTKLQAEGRDPEGRLAKLLDWSYDALDDDAKAVLVALGQLAEAPVPEVLLAGLLPQTNRAHGLQRLLRSGLIDRTSPGASTYHQHTLLWEWAARLGVERHQALVTELQQRVAESLKTHDEQVAPLLLTHILTAQRLAEERQQWDRVIALAGRVDAALGTFGYRGAQKDLLQRALNAAQQGTDRRVIAGILNNLGEVARLQGDYEAARKSYQQSLDLAQALGDRQVIANILVNLGIVAESRGDYEAARKSYQQSLDLAQALGDRQVIAKILLNLGNVAGSQGDYEAARKSYQQSLDLAQALGDRQVIAPILNNLGRLAELQGVYEAARKFYQQSLDLAQALGDRQVIAKILLNLGNVAGSQGDYEAARKSYQQSLDLAQALGARQAIGRVLAAQGLLAAKTGRKAEARHLLDQAIQIFQALGDPALVVAQQERAALGAAPDPVQCRKTCDELQAKGELAVPVAECVRAVCAD